MGIRRTNKDKEAFKFTEETIQDVLDNFFSRSYIMYSINNLYVFDWESDKLLKTRRGYYYEFEIKISKSDFKNDFKHKADKHLILEGDYEKNKYIPKYYEILEMYKNGGYGKYTDELIANLNKNPYYRVEGHKRPNYFYYACPKDLISHDEVPSYAGLIYIDNDGGIIIAKDAPKLHEQKYTDEELNLSEKFYYNMESWKAKSKKVLEYKKMLDEEIKSKGQKTSYAELEKKYKVMKILNDSLEKDKKILKDALYDTKHINHLLIDKIKELDKDFDYMEFLKDKDA